MIQRLTRSQVRLLVAVIAALVYFIIYPEDLATVFSPLASTATEVLSVSQAVSPWLYALAAVAVICWTVLRVWGRRPT